MSLVKIGVTIGLALAIGFAMAKAEEKVTMIGAGNNSCGAWTAAKSSGKRIEYVGWLLGYATGVNVEKGAARDVLKDTDADAIVGWMDNFCANAPLVRIEMAAEALIGELMLQQQPRLQPPR